MVGVEKDAGGGDAKGDKGGGKGDNDAMAARKQEPQRDDAGNGDSRVGGGKGGVLVAARDPCAVAFEAVPAGRDSGAWAGAATEDTENIGREAAGNGGAKHEQDQAGEERELEEPGDKEQEEKKNDDGGEVTPVGEELGEVPDGAAGMGGDAGNYGIVEKEGNRAKQGAGGEKQQDSNFRFSIFDFRFFRRVQGQVQVQVIEERNHWMRGRNFWMIPPMSSRRLLLLFFAFLGFYAAGDWALPLVDRDEPRFAEASREMLEHADFVVPYFNNQTRFDKPPLIYWLQDAAYKIFGKNEFAARLPSGVCGALATVVIALWGSQLHDPKTGWRAALMFGLCVQTIVHAHAAVADMAMIAASTASAWAGWNWLKAHRGDRQRARGWWLAFWGLLAVGFLAKGPIAWVPIGMTGWTAARMERGKRPGAPGWMLGAVLMLALVGIWGIPALVRTHGQFAAVGLGKHVVMRSVSPLEGHGAKTWQTYAVMFPFFFVTVWPGFFPWSLWLPAAAGALWVRRHQWRLDETYLVTGIALVFGIFTLSWTKLPHYTLPAFPFMALLLAAWWGNEREKAFRWAAGGMAVFGLALALVAFPLARPLFVSQRLYDQAAPWLTPEMELATVDYHEPSLVWLFRKKIRGFETSVNWKVADAWMQQPGPRVCVLPVDQLGRDFPELDPAWRVVKAQGWKVANGRRAELAAVIKP